MNGSFFTPAYNRVLATLALAALVAALAAYAYYTMQQAQYLYTGPTTISVNGEGEVMAVPDIGQFTFTVTSSGADAGLAQSEAAKISNDVIAYLKEQQVAQEDIKTEQYLLSPKYRYVQPPCIIGRACPTGEQIPDGFEATQSVVVKVRDMKRAGELMTEAGKRGVTNISGLSFTVDDKTMYQAEARGKAIADAQAQVEKLAEQLGVKVVRMTGYYEELSALPYYGYGAESKAMSAPAADMATPELPPGENVIKSRVSLMYHVKER